MVILTFTHSGPGRVVCHGDPPLSLRIDGEGTPCADPLAEWCEFQPDWTLGTHTLACVNTTGPSDPVVVEVPELGTLPGLLVALVFAAVVGWVVKPRNA